MGGIINSFFNNANKALVYSVLVLWVLLIAYLTTQQGEKLILGAVVSLLPAVSLFIVWLVRKPFNAFLFLFVINYFVSGLSRYFPVIAPGIFMDFTIIFVVIVLLLSSFRAGSEIKFSNAFNALTLIAFIWLLYCIFEIFNPYASSIIAWVKSARGIGVYFVLIVSIVAIVMRKYTYFKRVLFIWAILSLLAVLKAVIQKTVGFDSAELRWLYSEGGSVTHIIQSGVRYFSIFTDAANYGTGIAFSGVVFGISSLYYKKREKVFYMFTAAACLFGMFLSGTRGSLAVPFVGLAVYIFLSKNPKSIILTFLLVSASFVFLRYTYYGQGNQYIRRMRSFFNKEDASFMVRKINQQKVRTYMMDKPLGVGIGMSRAEVTTYRADPVLSTIPPDSWYVLVWMETGIVGLLLHLIILLYVVLYGGFLVLFRLKDHQLRGLMAALVCGISGIYVSSYSIEIIGQFPFGPILFMCMAFLFLSPVYDKEIENVRINTAKQNEIES